MKVKYTSDLHIDYNSKYYQISDIEIMQKLNLYNIDLLILAGDTAEYPYNLKFVDLVLRMYPQIKIIEVAGNHLYYSCRGMLMSMNEIDKMCLEYSKNSNNRYFFLNSNSIEIEGIKFIGACMWTKLSVNYMQNIKIMQRLNDFNLILNNELELLTYQDLVDEHTKSRKYIMKEVNNCECDKSIVITHHAPFFENYSEISNAFGIDLSNSFKRLKKYPTYWIYGHTHVNEDRILKYKNGQINCITNQMGYKGESEYGSQFNAWKTFNNNKVIEL